MTTSTTPWPAGFEDTLRAFLPLLQPNQPITSDLNLTDAGLDSLGAVNLLLALEDAFDLAISDELLTSVGFTDVLSIWSLVAAAGGVK